MGIKQGREHECDKFSVYLAHPLVEWLVSIVSHIMDDCLSASKGERGGFYFFTGFNKLQDWLFQGAFSETRICKSAQIQNTPRKDDR